MIDIKSRRKALGMSLEQVASLLGVNKSTVMRWESGQSVIRVDKAAKLAEILRIPAHQLLDREGENNGERRTNLGFLRVSGAVIETRVGGVTENTKQIISAIENTDCDVIVFPELAVTGYTCADLFLQQTLINQSNIAVSEIAETTTRSSKLVFVGAPVLLDGQLYNCAVVLAGGKIIGIVPKTFLPNYGEYYERRWFSSSEDTQRKTVGSRETGLAYEDYEIPFGRDLIFNINNEYCVSAEICE
ncbi:MAG: helix-turn-helix domain-containing protein, partial [Acutalibacteraceae bacterium]